MNLPRLRELVKAWQDGSIREAELHELRDALPEVLVAAEKWRRYCEDIALDAQIDNARTQDDYAARFGY